MESNSCLPFFSPVNLKTHFRIEHKMRQINKLKRWKHRSYLQMWGHWTDFNTKDLKLANDYCRQKVRKKSWRKFEKSLKSKIDETLLESSRSALKILLLCRLWLNFVFWYRNPIIKKQTTSVLSLPIHVLWFIRKAYLSLFSSMLLVKFHFKPFACVHYKFPASASRLT